MHGCAVRYAVATMCGIITVKATSLAYGRTGQLWVRAYFFTSHLFDDFYRANEWKYTRIPVRQLGTSRMLWTTT